MVAGDGVAIELGKRMGTDSLATRGPAGNGVFHMLKIPRDRRFVSPWCFGDLGAAIAIGSRELPGGGVDGVFDVADFRGAVVAGLVDSIFPSAPLVVG